MIDIGAIVSINGPGYMTTYYKNMNIGIVVGHDKRFNYVEWQELKEGKWIPIYDRPFRHEDEFLTELTTFNIFVLV